MTSRLDLETSQQGPVCILHCAGMLDGHTAPEFDRAMGALMQDNELKIVLDLEELTYVASAGVGVMINYLQQLQGKGGNLHIANPTSAVAEIFNLLGLQALLDIHQDVATAVTAADS